MTCIKYSYSIVVISVLVFFLFFFLLQASDLKKRIESLIERDYLRRSSENSSVYEYIA